MIYERIEIQVEGSLPESYAQTYIIDTPDGIFIKERPLIIVCPGGGYENLSFREGEPIALKFNSMGYHAIVLNYSVAPATYPTALLELGKLVSIARNNAKEWRIDKDRILVAGFSAGGHLAANYANFWNSDIVKYSLNKGTNELKINGCILSYPVITSGEFAHKSSFECLLGIKKDSLNKDNSNAPFEVREKLNMLSLENAVNEDTPKTFIWTTFEDGLVPPENSLLYVEALRRQNIPTEFHMYPKGHHGLALGTILTDTSDANTRQEEISTWIDLVNTFIESLCNI